MGEVSHIEIESTTAFGIIWTWVHSQGQWSFLVPGQLAFLMCKHPAHSALARNMGA